MLNRVYLMDVILIDRRINNMKDIITKIQEIETLVYENSEDLEVEYLIDEGLYDDYLEIAGASEEEITAFENKLNITMPQDMKELYRYKNGSDLFYLFFPNDKLDREFKFRLMSLEDIIDAKESLQDRDMLISEYYAKDEDEYTNKLIERMHDDRVKPYLFNKKWIPFAQADGDINLMLDFDPGEDGESGQIICFIHDPDEITYVAKSLAEIIDDSILNITFEDE